MLASLRYEFRMHRDVVHVPRPNQQRVGRVGGALVAVAAAFNHEAQVVVAGEIDGLGNVVSISRGDCVRAGLGSPRIDPSQGLRESGLIADVVRIFQILQQEFGGGAVGIGFEDRN